MAQSIDSDDQEVKEDDDDASNYSMSTSSSDISDLSNEFVNATEYQISVTKQKQYAQTLVNSYTKMITYTQSIHIILAHII